MIVQLTVTGSLKTLNSTKVPSLRIICRPSGTAAGLPVASMNIAAVAVGEILHPLHGVLLGDVDAHVGAHLAGDVQSVVLGIEGDPLTWLEQLGDLEHAEPDVANSGDDDGALLDLSRSTACQAQAAGSTYAASPAESDSGTLCTIDLAG